MFAGAVAGMLLIALLNGINLLLVRGAARARELGVRRAIGASRGRVVRQLMTESLVVALVSGTVAVALALGGVGALRRVMPSEFAFSSVYDFAVGPRPLLFTFLVSVGVGTLLGLLPALRAGGGGRLLPRGAGGRTGRRGRAGPRSVLVILETAVSVTLLAGAGLLANSFARLARTDPGFDPAGLVLMEIGLSETRYTSGVERAAFLREVEGRVEAIPGVEGATVASGLPTSSGFSFGVSLEAEGRPAPSEGQPILVPTASVSPDYLDVTGTPLRAGRNLRPGDGEAANVLVDEALAAYLWPDESPLGRRFRISEDGAWQTVVGVVADQKMMGPDDRQGRFEIFHALADEDVRPYMSLAVRTAGEGEAVVGALRRAVQELDPQQPVREIATARAALAESIAKPRFLLTVMGFLAGTAVVLTAVGLYGVLSYVVAGQRRDMGIRIALGATRGWVRGRVLAGGLTLAAGGILLGLGGALALDRLIQSLLFGVRPGDPATLASVAGLVLGVSALACYLPARRATRVDPVEVLAAE
jgi:putative ABC transport system permease protein